MSKILLVFFSRADENWFGGGIKKLDIGNTKVVAQTIEKLLKCDVCEIIPKEKYPVNYKKCCDQAKQEQISKARPEIIINISSVDSYDTILLGYPMWSGTYPMAVYTFLEKFDFSGKKILPFCTHEGSGFGSSIGELHKSCPNSSIQSGLTIYGSSCHSCEDKVRKWLKNSNL